MNKVKVSDAKLAASEIITEGKTGVRKCLGLLVNFWKSGVPGKCALNACAFTALFLMSCLLSGCGAESDDLAGASDNSESKKVSSPNGKEPSIKGFRLGMSRDEVLEACNKIASERGFKVNELSECILICAPNWMTLCTVRFKDKNSPSYAIEFSRLGIGAFFNSADLKAEEFCRLLVKNYSWIGSMEQEVEYTGSGTTTRWTYMSPNGYKVKVIEEGREITFGLYAIATEASRKFD